MTRKSKKSVLEEYKTTLILLSILLGVMSLILFMPLKGERRPYTTAAGYAK